jgi:hypothetical protein
MNCGVLSGVWEVTVIARKLDFLVLLTLVGTARVYGQAEPLPPLSGVAPPAVAPPANLWSFLLPTPAQKEACKAKLCNSPFVQLLNGATKPLSFATGGLIGPLCPDPLTTANAEDLKMSAESPQGAAARIKMDEAQAKKRVAALEYLGTVDCRYFPEAEAALVNGLRADTNECVRATAARVLVRGCCCTPKIVKALTATVSGSTKDGHPAERSELVLAYAYVALERCLNSCVEAEPEPMPEKPLQRPENPPSPEQALSLALAQFTEDQPLLPIAAEANAKTSVAKRVQVYAEARAALAKGINLSSETLSRLSRPRTVGDLFSTPVVRTAAPHPAVAATPEPKLLPANAKAAASPALEGGQTEDSRPKNLMSIFQATKRK